MTINESNAVPITEEFIGHLHRCSKHGIDKLVSNLTESHRGSLAIFCYGRGHLHHIALAIAATCSLESLVVAGGKSGNFLFEQSRDRPEADEPLPGSRRAKISLATNASRRSLDSEMMPVGI
jgi:hypothetical protein